MPAEHAVSVGFVEEAATPEVTKDATLEGTACPLQAVALEFLPVVRFEEGSFVEAGIPVGALRERAVKDDAVIVEVSVER